MGRYTQTGPEMVKEPPLRAGDAGFLGVNDRLDPSQLEPGLCSRAVNMRFTTGKPRSRKGIRKLNWMNLVVGRTVQPYGTIYGTGKFKDPNGAAWEVVAADGKVYLCREGTPPVQVGLPAGVTITAPVTFTQCFNVLVMFRGESLPELVMERIEEGFKAVPTAEEDLLPNEISGAGSENPTDGTEPIPNAARGTFLQNRLFIPYSRDLVGASDYLNYTRYSPVRGAFRVNQGSNDALVALGKFNETTLIAFKEQSVYAIGNLVGDLSGATLYEITSEYGLSAAKSIIAVGKDLWFLADKRGVCSITLTEQSKIQGRDVPASQDIEKTIKRINWRYAHKATAAYWDNRYYLAVPLDAAEVVKRNVIDPSAVYDGNGKYRKSLVPGRRYRWTKGAADTALTGPLFIPPDDDYPGWANPQVIAVVPGQRYRWSDLNLGSANVLTNGSEVFVGEDGPVIFTAQSDTVSIDIPDVARSMTLEEYQNMTGDFVATETPAVLKGTPGAAVTATVQPLFQGVNNAVLVYDFLAQKWSGYDQSEVIQVKDWSLAVVGGRQRLVFFSEDGFLNLYEEGTYDENILAEEPYSLEVRLLHAPAPGWTCRIDGDAAPGIEITATVREHNTLDGEWALGDPMSDAAALTHWMAPSQGGWFGAATPWTRPDHTVRHMSHSVVRFHYLTQIDPVLAAGQAAPAAARLVLSGADSGMSIEPVAEIFFEPVVSEMVSRGFLFDSLTTKSFQRLQIALATSKPRYSIEVLSDGVEEAVPIVVGRVKDRRRYYRPHDRADFVLDNQTGEYMDPFREDYSWSLEADETIYLDTKIDPDAMQEAPEQFWLRGRGRYAQVRVTNRDGRMEICSMVLEALLASERFGVHA